MLRILYEDRNTLVAVKPAGMLSQPADSAGNTKRYETAVGAVEEYLGTEQGSVGMITRLDCPVGGIMIFGKTEEATAFLTRLLTDGRITKEYLAVSGGVFTEKSGKMTDLLIHEKSRGITRTAVRGETGAKYAELEYGVISEYETDYGMSSLLRIKLITGRTHQIRAQLASRGAPIIGDGRYGSKDGGAKLALYSFRVTIPLRDGEITLTSLPDAEYPFREEDLVGPALK